MTTYLKWLIPAALAAAVGVWLFMDRDIAPPPETQPIERVAVSSASSIQYPLTPPTDAAAQPLPELDDSDAGIRQSLQTLLGKGIDELLVQTELVRHMVATIDNLPRRHLELKIRPVQPTPGTFKVSGVETDMVLDADNYARYATVMQLIESSDLAAVATWYRRHYPLFQKAYEGLGYPMGYFNDRLVTVIDHLLETPELQPPIRLSRPHVMYEFADPALEARSAGQKTLLRMGPENTRVIKAKLRELRAAIIRFTANNGAGVP